MKVAVSADGKDLDARADMRFGRAACFVVCDTGSGEWTAIDNGATAAAHGAGVRAAQTVIDSGAKAVITGNIGPNAMEVLTAAGISIYAGDERTVGELLEAYKSGSLPPLAEPRPKHFGLGRGSGRG